MTVDPGQVLTVCYQFHVTRQDILTLWRSSTISGSAATKTKQAKHTREFNIAHYMHGTELLKGLRSVDAG